MLFFRRLAPAAGWGSTPLHLTAGSQPAAARESSSTAAQAPGSEPASQSAAAEPATSPSAESAAPVATTPPPPAAVGYQGTHFDSPESAMTYLAAAYNSDNNTALHAVTTPNSYLS
jgi:hypothetical protein